MASSAGEAVGMPAAERRPGHRPRHLRRLCRNPVVWLLDLRQTVNLVPDRQRASETSLRRRLESAIERNKRLDEENKQLRDALARALGERRTVGVSGESSGPTGRVITPLIGPR
jgi:hypothetical protein